MPGSDALMATRVFHTPSTLIDRRVDVALIGCGGTGSALYAKLVSLDHVLRALDHPEGLSVTAFDGDTVSPTNVGRQAAFWPGDIGQNKAVTLVSRHNLFHGLDWRALPASVEPDDFDGLANDYDIVITCTDSAAFRVALGDYGRSHRSNALWLDTGNGRDDGQVVLGHLSDAVDARVRLANVLDLNPDLREVDDSAARQDSCSVAASLALQSLPINWIMADLALTLLWQLLREGQIRHHGALVDLATLKTVPIAIDPAAWAGFGYAPQSTASDGIDAPGVGIGNVT